MQFWLQFYIALTILLVYTLWQEDFQIEHSFNYHIIISNHNKDFPKYTLHGQKTK